MNQQQNGISQRSELVFLYDIKDANPNGDPMDENKPRIDEETGVNIVTDVRLKRTIRDYFHQNLKQEIFVREIVDTEGKIQDAKLRAEDFLIKAGKKLEKKGMKFSEFKSLIDKNVCEQCIDVRLFGVTLPIELDSKNKGSITHTGPVQFKIGRSLHRVYVKHFKGTGAFASEKDKKQKTFREEDFLLYSLIGFYGIINENTATHTGLTVKDVDFLLEAMWNGTKGLISRSKVGQTPRLLCKINYKDPNYHIGDLNSLLVLRSDLPDEQIRDISELRLDSTQFVDILIKNKDKIASIDLASDDRVHYLYNDKDQPLKDTLSDKGFKLNILSF